MVVPGRMYLLKHILQFRFRKKKNVSVLSQQRINGATLEKAINYALETDSNHNASPAFFSSGKSQMITMDLTYKYAKWQD